MFRVKSAGVVDAPAAVKTLSVTLESAVTESVVGWLFLDADAVQKLGAAENNAAPSSYKFQVHAAPAPEAACPRNQLADKIKQSFSRTYCSPCGFELEAVILPKTLTTSLEINLEILTLAVERSESLDVAPDAGISSPLRLMVTVVLAAVALAIHALKNPEPSPFSILKSLFCNAPAITSASAAVLAVYVSVLLEIRSYS